VVKQLRERVLFHIKEKETNGKNMWAFSFFWERIRAVALNAPSPLEVKWMILAVEFSMYLFLFLVSQFERFLIFGPRERFRGNEVFLYQGFLFVLK